VFCAVRLLVVEDEPKMAEVIRRALTRAGYAVDVVADGEEALWAAGENDYDAVVLDAVIPAPDGFEVSRRLRAGHNGVPVLLLTARDALADRVAGLDAGADDYLTKPFAFEELLARVRALVRRGPSERSPVLHVGDLELDPATHQAWRAGRPLELAPKAFAALEYLMRNPGRVVTRTELREHVWDFAFEAASNAVDQCVSRVRDAVERDFDDAVIETVRGVGYRLRVPDQPL
jgi:two-component system OmpR family response regulator